MLEWQLSTDGFETQKKKLKCIFRLLKFLVRQNIVKSLNFSLNSKQLVTCHTISVCVDLIFQYSAMLYPSTLGKRWVRIPRQISTSMCLGREETGERDISDSLTTRRNIEQDR